MDLAQPLAQGEDVEIFVVQPRAALDELHHKAGQGPEDQQGARRSQPQHGEAQKGNRNGQRHAEGEQNGVSGDEADHPQHKLEHRHSQGPGLQHLVFPLPVDQVNELCLGHLHPAEDHHQQEDYAEVQHRLARRPGGKSHSQHVGHVYLEHGQSEGGHPKAGRHPQGQSGGQGDQADEARLQKEQAGHLPLAQAQQQVGAQLPLPAAEEKAVGVEDQAGQHHRHEDGKNVYQRGDGLHDGVAYIVQIDQRPLAVQGVEGVEQADAKGEGEQIHPVVPKGPAHVAQGQLREHRPSLLPFR